TGPWPGSASAPVRRSRCWCSRSAARPCWPPRWRPGASAAAAGRGRGPAGCRRPTCSSRPGGSASGCWPPRPAWRPARGGCCSP
ncbi:MAG: Transmembrane component YkoC of energizing module of thiamin-regulated ECF transporter for HydroxyMethylPyrimidine, partial [uncultured Quadrisphaera sp.]